jgi:hypothetical protein
MSTSLPAEAVEPLHAGHPGPSAPAAPPAHPGHPAHPGGHVDGGAHGAGPSLPQQVIDMMAAREHRMHHWLWHEVRNSWHRYSKDIQGKIEDMGWKPPRPVMNEASVPDLENNAGEDFLYMHRQMIADVNAVLASVGDPNYPRVQGWIVPPPPGDPDYPVPPAWFDPTGQDPNTGMPFARLQRIKSDVYYQKRFRFWQRSFTDPTYLRSVSLGTLGTMIEMSIHNMMHQRWAANPGSSRPEPQQPTGGETIGREWDDPRYDFLGDTYSSHVKIANGVFGDDFWQGTWVGKMPEHEEGATLHATLEVSELAGPHTSEMEQVGQLIAQTGVFLRPFAQPGLDDT